MSRSYGQIDGGGSSGPIDEITVTSRPFKGPDSGTVTIGLIGGYFQMRLFDDSGNAGVSASRFSGPRLGAGQNMADFGGLVTTAVGLVVGSYKSTALALRELAAFRFTTMHKAGAPLSELLSYQFAYNIAVRESVVWSKLVKGIKFGGQSLFFLSAGVSVWQGGHAVSAGDWGKLRYTACSGLSSFSVDKWQTNEAEKIESHTPRELRTSDSGSRTIVEKTLRNFEFANSRSMYRVGTI